VLVDRGEQGPAGPSAIRADESDRRRLGRHRLVRPEREGHPRLRGPPERRPHHAVGLAGRTEIDSLLRPGNLESQQLARTAQG
jgi:hypothetical protein